MSTCFDRGYALLIGVGECAHKDWSLPVTVKDIHAVQKILMAPELCGYPADNIRLLHDENATRDKILQGLAWLKEKSSQNPDCTVLIYYSGHGWYDRKTGNYYLIPHDVSEDPNEIVNTALSAEAFTNGIREIQSQRVLVTIDSCHAWGMAATKGEEAIASIPPRFLRTMTPKNILTSLSQGKGRAVFTSCDGDEKSWIRNDDLMSIYTYHFVEALQGAGNSPDDTVVRLSNLMNYLAKTVPESAKRQFGTTQTPNFDISNEDFGVTIGLLRGGKGLPKEGWDALKDEAAAKIRHIVQAVGAGSMASAGNMTAVQGNNSGNVAMGGGSIHNTSSQDTYTTTNQGSKTYNNPIYNQQGSTNYNAEVGTAYNSQGGDIQVGDRIYHQVPPKPKATFEKLVKGIAKKFTYLEHLPPFEADEVWKILRNESREGFEELDLAVFKLVVSYCCYYCNHRITPIQEYQNFGEMDYFHRARQFNLQGKLSRISHPLSAIVKSHEMAELIRGME